MNKNELIALTIALMLAFTMVASISYFRGIRKGQQQLCGDLVKKLEGELVLQKESAYQKDIENLKQNGCKEVLIRAINSNNEVKLTQFIQTDMMGNTKVVRIRIDGIEKNYEYHNFMQKVVKVECGDFFKW